MAFIYTADNMRGSLKLYNDLCVYQCYRRPDVKPVKAILFYEISGKKKRTVVIPYW